MSYYTQINNPSFIVLINCNTDNSLSLTLCKLLVSETYFNFALEFFNHKKTKISRPGFLFKKQSHLVFLIQKWLLK